MQKLIIKETPTKFKAGDYPSGITGKLINYEVECFNEKGELILGYYKVPLQIMEVARQVCKGTKPKKSTRTSHGVPQLSAVYGALPRVPIREDYCRFSRQSKEEKENFSLALKLNYLLSEFYKAKHPALHQAALLKTREEVNTDYLLVDTPWSNINVNLNQVIKYHFDKGNNPEDLSNVLIVKKGVNGGHLDCPSLGVALAQDDGWVCFFRGQEIIHGVTPCTFTNESSFRCSIVNYTLRGLKNCYPYEQELLRLKQVKTSQAVNRKASLEKLRKYLESAKAKK